MIASLFIIFLTGAALGIAIFAWFTRHECDAAFKQGRDFAEKVTARTYANVYRMGYEARRNRASTRTWGTDESRCMDHSSYRLGPILGDHELSNSVSGVRSQTGNVRWRNVLRFYEYRRNLLYFGHHPYVPVYQKRLHS